jgi:hypothetical protein
LIINVYYKYSAPNGAKRNDIFIILRNFSKINKKNMRILFINILLFFALIIPDSIYSQNQVDYFKFYKNYFPGTYDVNNKYMGGTDIMYITSHKGKLYAGNSYWNDNPGPDPSPGPQILIKESSSSNWKVDTSTGTGYLRTDALYSFIFKVDKNGVLLPRPDTLLIASFSDISSPYQISVWSRNDSTCKWTKMTLYNNSGTETSYIRHIAFYKDKITGIEHLFAASPTAVFRGAYNVLVPGKIEWQAIEIHGPQRMLSHSVFNGDLYIAFASDGNPTNNWGGIFKRIDGYTPSWQFIYEWPDTGATGLGKNLRGMTTVLTPNNLNQKILWGIAENLRSAILIDPATASAVIENNFENYFDNVWGINSSFYYGAYNNTLLFLDPQNGDTALLYGIWARHSSGFGTPLRNNSWYMIRYKNSVYKYGQVIDSAYLIPATPGLQATRTICKSPFPDEPTVYYFGGFDAGGQNPIYHNTAWLYKGVLRTYLISIKPVNNIIPEKFELFQNYPNPFNSVTSIKFKVASQKFVKLVVFDLLGREVKTLVNEELQPGEYSVRFDEASLQSGVYFCKLVSVNFTDVKKLILIK